jgi:hypothetical protein
MSTLIANPRDEMTGTAAVRGGVLPFPVISRDGQNGEVNGFSVAPEAGQSCCGEALRPFWLEDGRMGAVCRKCGQKFTDNTQMQYGGSPWIGVDLDGTLARDLGSARWNEIGSPIEPMLLRVKRWIAEGRTVKIFTARASSPRQVAAIKEWLTGVGLPDLEVTNVKDQRMIELWDDRCVQVTTNLGEPISAKVKLKHRKPARVDREDEPAGFFSRLRLLLMTF